MFCRIAELTTIVPPADGMAVRCKDYLYEANDRADIIIRSELYREELFFPQYSRETMAYMESAYQFYKALVGFHGFYLHSSTIVYKGKAYLFSGDSGAGKSTHTRLWQQTFGPDARVINDDKPALRCVDGVWYAYGTPWCGKDGININEKAPVAGVCFLVQAPENRIRKLTAQEALSRMLRQTIFRFQDAQTLDLMLENMNQFLTKIPVYELENRPEPAAAQLSFETMRLGAQERGL